MVSVGPALWSLKSEKPAYIDRVYSVFNHVNSIFCPTQSVWHLRLYAGDKLLRIKRKNDATSVEFPHVVTALAAKVSLNRKCCNFYQMVIIFLFRALLAFA